MKKGTRYIRHAFALGLLLMLTIVSFAYAENEYIDIDRAQMQELDRAVRSYPVSEGGVIDPNQARIWELEREDKYRRERKESDDSDITYATIQAVEYTTITAPTLGGKGKWIISYNTKYYGTPIKTIVRLLMKDYSNEYTTVYRKEYDGFQSVVTSPTIVSGGEYSLSILVKSTTSGSGAYGDDYFFSIADDSAHTSLTEKVASIVASCKAGTQWQTALNLHDWIVNHVYYDLNYEYYGADMILRGYGVCDGYAKAFYMLCKKAGIRVERVVNDNHAWNAILLDGNWYYVDCTWDDPATGKPAKSGYEGHNYFCLNTDLLALDHPKPWKWENTTAQSCTALDDNYYVRLNKWNDLGNRYRNDAYEWTTYSEEIAKQIASNRGGNYIDLSITLPIKDTTIIRNWRLLAYAMSKQPMYIPGYGNVSIDVHLNESYGYFIYFLNGYTIKETGTFTLPASLTAIDEEVFLNTSASTIIIPSGCKSIGKKAFSGSNVHRIYIPESVTSIEESAFDGCSSVLIFCEYDSEARAFAQDHDILWHYP